MKMKMNKSYPTLSVHRQCVDFRGNYNNGSMFKKPGILKKITWFAFARSLCFPRKFSIHKFGSFSTPLQLVQGPVITTPVRVKHILVLAFNSRA